MQNNLFFLSTIILVALKVHANLRGRCNIGERVLSIFLLQIMAAIF